MSVVALDIGSSRLKALLADWDGHIVEVRSLPTPRLSREPGEQAYPAEGVLAAARELVSGLAADHVNDPLEAIAFSCLGTAMVPLDRAGVPLAPALAPADARPLAGPPVAERLGLDAEQLRDLTGSDPRIASALLHLLWWRDRHPEVIERTHRFRSLRGHLVAALCGADAEDPSWASRTMLLDLRSLEWSPLILAAAGLSRDVLPAIAPSTACWPVAPGMARRFGLSPRAVVVLGGMDNGCSLLGATDPDEASLANIVGTYEHMAGAAGLDVALGAARAVEGLVHAYPLAGFYIAMTRVPMGELLAAVGAAHTRGLDDLLAAVSPEPQGASIDLTVDAVREALDRGMPARVVLQAVLESAAALLARFVTAWESQLGRPVSITAVGGGSGSPEILRLKTAILGRTLAIASCDEAAGLGALRLAAMALHGLSPAEACRRFVNPVRASVAPEAPRIGP